MIGKVPSYGPSNARIMIVGEAPGEREEREGRPFVGPAGNVLRELLLKAGIDPDRDVFYTNVCKYRPPNNEFEAFVPKGVPNSLVLDGMDELQEEIERVNPNVIIPVGNWPLWAFYTDQPKGIGSYRGSILEARKLGAGRKLVPTYHPSYILRGAYAEAPIVVLDLSRARAQSSFPGIRRATKDLIIDPQGPDRFAVEERLRSAACVTFDIEYTGKLHCIGFTGGSDWAACIPIRGRDDLAWCKSILESGVPLNAQNAMFDVSILEWHYGFDLMHRLAHDTMVGAYVLNVEYPKSLDFLTSIYTEQPYYKDMVDWNRIKAGTQSIEELYHYNCIDTWVTHSIMEQQREELKSDPAFQRAFDFDMAKLPALWDVAKTGVKIDVQRMEELKSSLARDRAVYEAEINGVAALFPATVKPPVNVKSCLQVAKLLFDALSIPSGGKTPGGQRKVDDITLADCFIKCSTDLQRDTIKAVRGARECRDLDSKFCEIELDDDSRIRCHYDPCKTETRRLSSREFYPTGRGANLQNIPTDKRARSVFIPDAGMEFGYADLKGAEFLVVAELTQDTEMLRLARMTIEGTGDVHKTTAAYLFDKPFESITAEERYLGKRTRHSSNYMVGWKKLMMYINAAADETGVTIDAKTAKRLVEGYRSLHPGLAAWWREVEWELRQTHTLRNLFGFKRIFHDRLDTILPNAVAFVPQSTVGDALNFGLLNCARDRELRELGFQILLQVHDAIGYQYPSAHRSAVNARVRALMDVAIPIPKTGRNLHIPVEVAVGPSWGEVKVWEEDLKEKEAAA